MFEQTFCSVCSLDMMLPGASDATNSRVFKDSYAIFTLSL